MIKRAISSIILISLLFTSVYYAQGLGLAVIFVILSALAIYELSCILHSMNIYVNKLALQVANITIMISTLLIANIHSFYAQAISSVLFFLICFSFAIRIFKDLENKALQKNIIASILSLLVITFSLHFFVLASSINYILVIWAIFVTKFTDIGGYVFGVCFGNHKIMPKISPGKSWEGLFGGLFSSVVIGTFAVVAFREHFPERFGIFEAGIWAVSLGFLGFLSDLLESAFKRLAKTKDSGSIIPGIGGVLDLVDSMIISAPLTFLITYIA